MRSTTQRLRNLTPAHRINVLADVKHHIANFVWSIIAFPDSPVMRVEGTGLVLKCLLAAD